MIQTKLTATPTCYQEYRITHLWKDGCGNKKIFIFQWYSRFTENKFRRSNPIFSTNDVQARLILRNQSFLFVRQFAKIIIKL